MNRLIDGQINRWINEQIQMDIFICRQMDRQIDRYMDRQIEGQIDRWIDRQIDEKIDRLKDRQIDEKIDGQRDREMDKQMDRQIVFYAHATHITLNQYLNVFDTERIFIQSTKFQINHIFKWFIRKQRKFI